MSEACALGEMRERILEEALRQVPFEGWTEKALTEGARAAGFAPEMALEAFPGGVTEAIEEAAARADRAMLAALEEHDLKAMRTRDRIALALRLRLELATSHREAIQRSLPLMAQPQNLPLAARMLWRTVDAIWYAAGDASTDFNFYTKRGLLAGVYSAGLLYWLNDQSAGSAETWAFIGRRLDDALRIPGALGRVRAALENIPSPFRTLRGRMR
jgi:ubiquinone biosynthesis protein COQ9